MSKLNIPFPIKVEMRGHVSLGPVPGTPEYEEEQRLKKEQHGNAQHCSEECGSGRDQDAT